MRYDHRQIKRGRLVKGWSQPKLGNIAGVHHATVGRVERGEHMGPETVKKLADALGLDMAELVIEEEEATSAA